MIKTLYDPEHMEQRMDAIDHLVCLIGEDADKHGLYDELDDIKDGPAQRRRLALMIIKEAKEMYDAADDPQHWREELADVHIMSCSAAYCTDTELGLQVERKRMINIQRPFKHEVGENG